MDPVRAAANTARRALGLLTIEQNAALIERGVFVLDPYSTFIGPDVRFGANVTLWPNTTLTGHVTIGDHAEIGAEGGFTLQADNAHIHIGAHTRLLGGGALTLENHIGDGAQILGPIRAQHCTLGAGGSWRDPDPDRRGGVLKGNGVARNLIVPQGYVIQAFGLFADATMRRQSYFHPVRLSASEDNR